MADAADESRYEIARITIIKVIEDDDVVINTDWSDGLALVDALGMLRLAEDTVIRGFMGEDGGNGDA
jgi:hypothetical protein